MAGANAALMRSDWEAVRTFGARLVGIGRAHGSPHALVRGLLAQAWAANNEGDFDAAVELLEEAREPAAATGVTAAVEFELGDSLLQRGSYEEAERFFESVLRPDYPDRSSGLVIAALLNVGAARLATGRRDAAAAAFLDALRTSVESGLHITAGPALAHLAAAMAQQEPLAAARLLGAGEGLGGLYDSPVERALREAAVDELTAGLGPETFARLRAEGRLLSLEEALREATAQAASWITS
jgi:tetratricopeptide (TPR) repeat protein